eukprot:8802576-Pyramimonas_sp.AAC.1
MTDQSDTGNPTAGLDTDAVNTPTAIKTLPSHLVTRAINSPADSLGTRRKHAIRMIYFCDRRVIAVVVINYDCVVIPAGRPWPC